MTKPLAELYRPTTFEEVIGHEAVLKALQSTIKRKSHHAFLFSGPFGIGKTTLARLTAQAFDATRLEIDGATFTGIDSMRVIQDKLHYKTFDQKGRAIILDEAHRLSQNAWDSLLKPIEEPPPKVIWCLCTTAVDKVPKTIRSRCASFPLTPIDEETLTEYLRQVMAREKIKVSDEVLELVIDKAEGSPRQALVNLEKCRGLKTSEEAAKVLQAIQDTDPVIKLCQFIVKGGSWSRAMNLVDNLNGQNPESVRIVMVNYLGAVLKNAGTDKAACEALLKLEAFATPYQSYENLSPLLLSIGRCLFSE